MGACCSKGGKAPVDPDKTPYGPTRGQVPPKSGKKKKQTTTDDGAKPQPIIDANTNEPSEEIKSEKPAVALAVACPKVPTEPTFQATTSADVPAAAAVELQRSTSATTQDPEGLAFSPPPEEPGIPDDPSKAGQIQLKSSVELKHSTVTESVTVQSTSTGRTGPEEGPQPGGSPKVSSQPSRTESAPVTVTPTSQLPAPRVIGTSDKTQPSPESRSPPSPALPPTIPQRDYDSPKSPPSSSLSESVPPSKDASDSDCESIQYTNEADISLKIVESEDDEKKVTSPIGGSQKIDVPEANGHDQPDRPVETASQPNDAAEVKAEISANEVNGTESPVATYERWSSQSRVRTSGSLSPTSPLDQKKTSPLSYEYKRFQYDSTSSTSPKSPPNEANPFARYEAPRPGEIFESLETRRYLDIAKAYGFTSSTTVSAVSESSGDDQPDKLSVKKVETITTTTSTDPDGHKSTIVTKTRAANSDIPGKDVFSSGLPDGVQNGKRESQTTAQERNIPTSPYSRLPVVNRSDEGATPEKPPSTPAGNSTRIAKGVSATKPAPNVPPSDQVRTQDIAMESKQRSISLSSSSSSSDEEITHWSGSTETHKTSWSYFVDLSIWSSSVMSRHKYQPNTRVKLMGCLDKWVTGQEKEKPPKVRVIWGKPGMGKTCLASELIRKHSDFVVAYHFFDHCPPRLRQNDPRRVICSLASQISKRLPEFAEALGTIDDLDETVCTSSVDELWQKLITEPLCAASAAPTSGGPMVIILDSLDDCVTDERESLLQCINTFGDNSPSWARLLATVRDDNKMMSQLDAAYSIELKNSSDNVTDIKRFLREPLSPYMDRISLDGGLTSLAKKTEGNFLCAHLMAGKLAMLPSSKKIALREIDGIFQTGLKKTLYQIFQAFLGQLESLSSPNQAQNEYEQILGMLINAQGPICEDFVSHVTDLDSRSILNHLDPVLTRLDSEVSICHKYITEWLTNEQESGRFALGASNGRSAFQECCLKWLLDISGDKGAQSVEPQLQAYALKYAITHLTDVPKQQENVTQFLCNLRYIQAKLALDDVDYIDLESDYHHSHHQVAGDKKVVLGEYMKRQPRLMKEIEHYHKFIKKRKAELTHYPQFTFHIAANYADVERIQQNAKVEISNKAWMEDEMASNDSPGLSKMLCGSMVANHISPDGKTHAIVTDDEGRIQLHLLNIGPNELKTDMTDITHLKDRIGTCARFMPDGNVFASSLTTLVNLRGKTIPSGFDIGSVQMKEKFSLECCDVSGKHLVCGVSTLPHGGRSLHLLLFDIKTKKCTKTLEILKFRFGGSSQFGVRSCALNANDTLVCACSKQINKPQIKATVWSMTKWAALYSVDLPGDGLYRCSFLASKSLLIGSGPAPTETSNQTCLWNPKESSVKILNQNESHSVFNVDSRGRVTVTSWVHEKSNKSLVSVWKNGNPDMPPDVSFELQGPASVSCFASFGDVLLFGADEGVVVYNVNNLERVDPSAAPSLKQIGAANTLFLPRSDNLLVSHYDPVKGSPHTLSVSDVDANELQIGKTHITDQTRQVTEREGAADSKYFIGVSSPVDMCSVSADGTFIVMNCGSKVLVHNKNSGSLNELPTYMQMSGVAVDNPSDVRCLVSPKDCLVAVIYGELPHIIHLYNLKSRQTVQKIQLDEDEHGDAAERFVSDFSFQPSTGYLVSYHYSAQHTLAFWNHSTGKIVDFAQDVPMAYAKTSPSLDRVVLSLRRGKKAGELLLRNSDGKCNVMLDVPAHWMPSCQDSDLAFSPDGTIIIGISAKTSIGRAWNSGNGEVLKDMQLNLLSPTVIVGMPTNTHVMLLDGGWLVTADVALGEIQAVLPLSTVKLSGRLQISPRGNRIAGVSDRGEVVLVRCHNFSGVKRTTTLQRMKSVVK